MNKSKKQDSTKLKNKLWKELEKIYRKSVSSAANLIKKTKVCHFYEDKYGWDDNPQPLNEYGHEEMTPEEIFIWMYDNDVNPRNLKTPFIYTDSEIEFLKKNRNMLKIEECKKTIEFYKAQITKYEARIEDLQNTITNGEANK